ncbi:MAG TPA: HAMP domain-containing sensor histidine kinase [Chitinophagaceae bacterium]|nr:HAMP domain-containing sensor histidine kinase [Chitinophagaceae bacterium]
MKFQSIIHILLLAYIIAALSFWWLSLEKQSRVIYDKEIIALRESMDASVYPVKYERLKEEINLRRSKRSKQYLGEGLTFLFVILVGSSIVYTTHRFSNRLSRQQNNFMLSVTHELKSPIAAMKLTLQTLQKHKLDEQKQAELLQRCVTEADRLHELCNNILIASQMEGGQYERDWERISLTGLVQSCFDAYKMRYPHRFIAQIEEGIAAETDRMLLQMAINNLLENAVKYTPDDQPITVVLQQQQRRALICIKDLGPGIQEEEKRKVFEKFYRVGNEDTRKTKGTGLGLYLTKKIMTYLKGNVVLRDNKPRGSIFELSVPVVA